MAKTIARAGRPLDVWARVQTTLDASGGSVVVSHFLRPEVSPLQAAAFRRSELRAQAELAWHDEWDRVFGPAAEAST